MISIKKIYFFPIITFMLFLILLILVECDVFNNFDKNIMKHIYDIRGSKGSFGYYFFRSITEFGDFIGIIIVIIVLIIWWKLDYKLLMLAGGTIFTAIINKVCKIIVARPRPSIIMQQMNETSSSFPSGHSISAFFFYMLLLYYIIKGNYNKSFKRIMTALCIVMVVLVGLSRMILGMHYLTDVTGGFLLGSVCVFFAIEIDKIIINKKSNNVNSRL